MLKNTCLQTLPLTAWFNDAFPDPNNEFGLIPDNSIIDKNKPGFGITHSELMAKRNSILPLPYVPIIESKLENEYPYSRLFSVTKGVTPKMIEQYLTINDGKFKKILVTPESFYKVIIAAYKFGSEWIYKNFFCYIDEMHAYAIDAFRGDEFLTPLRHVPGFAKYKNLALGSATPYEFSHPLLKTLSHHSVRFNEKFGKISIAYHKDPKTILNDYLTNPDQFPGKVFIFFNSVTAIAEAITLAKLTDVSIFCREDEVNMTNLDESIIFFKSDVNTQFSKFNFFTCRYYEGFDLKGDTSSTIILVTDTHIPHTLVGINFRGAQSVGRLRLNAGEKPFKIIHITNTLDKPCMAEPKMILAKLTRSAKYDIKNYNKRVSDDIPDGFDLTDYILKFSDIEKGIAVINTYKIDQHVYAATFKRHYNSLDSIQKCWESCNYDTEVIHFSLGKIQLQRKSKSEINKNVIEMLELYKKDPTKYSLGHARREINKLKNEHSNLFQAYHMFGPLKLKEWDYKDNKMKEELIILNNKNSEAKLRSLVAEYFEIGDYDKKHVKDKLQAFYDHLEIKNKDGKRKIAFANDLDALEMFKIQKPNPKNSNGKRKEIYRIVKKLFIIKVAA